MGLRLYACAYSRAELGGLVPELLQQVSVAGVGQQGAGSGVSLQLLMQVGDRKWVHHLLLCRVPPQNASPLNSFPNIFRTNIYCIFMRKPLSSMHNHHLHLCIAHSLNIWAI